MNPSCENQECSRYNLPMRERVDIDPCLRKCEECGAVKSMTPESLAASTIPSNEGEQQLLDRYYQGHYGQTYRQHRASGNGPYDTRRR
ncbi:MAG: hypothetical protein L0228_15050 [Planctomycetes bacterium]|nr:hypothetical protein [Planctomycetota bacterium]